ncbi:MAG: lanthionine synthetase LanC family protein [Acidobacteriota bacterium]
MAKRSTKTSLAAQSSQASLAADLAAIVEAVRILSPNLYQLNGELRPALPQQPPPSGSAESRSQAEASAAPSGPDRGGTGSENPLIAALEKDLYHRLYTRAGVPSPLQTDLLARRDHMVQLSRANCGRGTWEPGWKIRHLEEDGRVAVHKNGLGLWVLESRLRCRSREIVPGERCRVRIGKELREFQSGYYMAVGDGEEGEQQDRTEPTLRFYWHVTARGAAPLMRALTARLNSGTIPFRFKVLSNPQSYGRADAAVLYVSCRHYAQARQAVVEIYRQAHRWLSSPVPLLTRRLAPGLALAEDPGNGQSFGDHRCRLVARGLWRAFEQGCATVEECGEAVASQFLAAGLDPRLPHLGRGSKGIYPPLSESERPEGQKAGSEKRSGAGRASLPETPGRGISGQQRSSKLSFLEEAARIGEALCRQAYWHQGRCNWIGRVSDQEEVPGGLKTSAVEALGPDLYSGSCGISLFLAHLHALTGNPEFRRTAQGAIGQAFDCIERELADLPPLSLYAGQLGVVYAARSIGALTGLPQWAEKSQALLSRVLNRLDGQHMLDMISGNAGAVLALLALHRGMASQPCVDAALALGQEICRSAVRTESDWRWENARAMGLGLDWPPLTGFSHGAAGMGLALLELWALGRDEFRAGAAGAFAYEDSLFNAEQGNWPDLRTADDPSYMVAWCHGAPGIALSRLRAMAIDPDHADSYAVAAQSGVATTLGRLEKTLQQPEPDTCLCHGWAGLIETALMAGRMLGEESHCALAMEACRALLAEHCPPRDRVIENPSLMVGEAGLGYTLLRLCEPDSVPSVLLVTR